MQKTFFSLVQSGMLLLLAAGWSGMPVAYGEDAAAPVTFEDHVSPILKKNCTQ